MAQVWCVNEEEGKEVKPLSQNWRQTNLYAICTQSLCTFIVWKVSTVIPSVCMIEKPSCDASYRLNTQASQQWTRAGHKHAHTLHKYTCISAYCPASQDKAAS